MTSDRRLESKAASCPTPSPAQLPLSPFLPSVVLGCTDTAAPNGRAMSKAELLSLSEATAASEPLRELHVCVCASARAFASVIASFPRGCVAFAQARLQQVPSEVGSAPAALNFRSLFSEAASLSYTEVARRVDNCSGRTAISIWPAVASTRQTCRPQ